MKKNTKKDNTFETRLARHYDELKWLYFEIYNCDENAFSYFLQMLRKNYEERSEKLRKLDAKREQNSTWYTEQLLGMQMYTQCFAGTLNGIREHLDYIKECGVNYVHLMPLLRSPKEKSDGGYAVSDFRSVEPALGTMEDLEALTDACHAKGMSVCLDYVLNHTSEDHEWAKRARNGEKEYQDKYFFFENRTIPDDFDRTMPQVFPVTAPGNFTWCEEAGKYVMTCFYPFQWDLNYRNPTVFNDMTDNMLNLCNKGIDVIRLDAVPYIWKTLGTSCRNLPQVHTLVRIMRMTCEIVCPGTLLLGEIVMEPSKVVPYFGTVEKPECHILYNVTTMASTWHTVATHDVRLLKQQLATVFALPRMYTFLNYLRCHDDIGWGLDYGFLWQFGIDQTAHKKFLNDYFRGLVFDSPARGELYNDDPRLGDARLCGTTASLCGVESALLSGDTAKLEQAVRLDLMLHAFLFTQRGIPVLYSGDEIGQLNDMSYHEDPIKCEDSRYIHRGDLDWTAAAERKNKKTVPGKIFQGLRKMEKIRKGHRCFADEADLWLEETLNDHILGIGRYLDGEEMIALFNFGTEPETAWIDKKDDYTDLMTGKSRPAKNITVPAGDFIWLIKEHAVI